MITSDSKAGSILEKTNQISILNPVYNIIFAFGELFANPLISIKWLYYTAVMGFCGLSFWIIFRFNLNKNRLFICESCSMFPPKYKIKRPGDYYKIIEKVKEQMNQGKLFLIEGSCSLDEINKDKPFPDDIIQHKFKCIPCGCIFELFVDSYHGDGYWIIEK